MGILKLKRGLSFRFKAMAMDTFFGVMAVFILLMFLILCDLITDWGKL